MQNQRRPTARIVGIIMTPEFSHCLTCWSHDRCFTGVISCHTAKTRKLWLEVLQVLTGQLRCIRTSNKSLKKKYVPQMQVRYDEHYKDYMGTF